MTPKLKVILILVTAAARILEVGHWPNGHEQLSVFGEEEVNVFDHFKQLLDFNQEKALSE